MSNERHQLPPVYEKLGTWPFTILVDDSEWNNIALRVSLFGKALPGADLEGAATMAIAGSTFHTWSVTDPAGHFRERLASDLARHPFIETMHAADGRFMFDAEECEPHKAGTPVFVLKANSMSVTHSSEDRFGFADTWDGFNALDECHRSPKSEIDRGFHPETPAGLFAATLAIIEKGASGVDARALTELAAAVMDMAAQPRHLGTLPSFEVGAYDSLIEDTEKTLLNIGILSFWPASPSPQHMGPRHLQATEILGAEIMKRAREFVAAMTERADTALTFQRCFGTGLDSAGEADRATGHELLEAIGRLERLIPLWQMLQVAADGADSIALVALRLHEDAMRERSQ